MSTGIIDNQGYRLNVGIVVANQKGELFWGQRKGNPDAWQFPQGGMQAGETAREAMYRELTEELGLMPADVELLAETRGWLRYQLPKAFQRRHAKQVCIGQRQKWFLLRLISSDDHIRLLHSPEPEFAQWRWVAYWYPLQHVISFKRDVYDKVLKEFENKIR
jgi:putative (di)nucleoside polyphosphate hydrolase